MLNERSLKRLEGVHPHLVKVIKRAAEKCKVEFQISEGVRTVERQKELKAAGASQTLNSRHLIALNGFSHAVDVVAYVGGIVDWTFELYARIADSVKAAALELGVPIEWGGDWKTLRDGPHFQLPWAQYPGITSISDPMLPQPTEDDLKTLAISARGDEVRTLQTQLNAHGAGLRVDGDFGPATRKAVMNFQKSKGLTIDGIVGKLTRKALANG
jgi:Putative peptidoglycan-binding domain-containing protein